jgi:hypothetical protein
MSEAMFGKEREIFGKNNINIIYYITIPAGSMMYIMFILSGSPG